jgi:hypothetical protein
MSIALLRLMVNIMHAVWLCFLVCSVDSLSHLSEYLDSDACNISARKERLCNETQRSTKCTYKKTATVTASAVMYPRVAVSEVAAPVALV